MRILLLTQWFQPVDFHKGLPFAQELRRLGHDVQVLTTYPYDRSGKILAGYRLRLYQRETLDGIPVLRVPIYPSNDLNPVRRIVSYTTFAVSALIAVLFMRKPDVVYVYHPPATAALPAVALQIVKGVPFLCDVCDLWPDGLYNTGMVRKGIVSRMIAALMRFVYRRADHINVLSKGFRNLLIERGVPPEKISVIPNWTHEDTTASGALEHKSGSAGPTSNFTVVYAGNMGPLQALDIVIAAAVLLETSAPGVRFLMIGSGVDRDRLRSKAEAEKLSNIDFLPQRPAHEMGEVFDMADALLVHLKDEPAFAVTFPSKIQAYLRAGKPLLVGVRGDASDIIDEAGAGVSFQPEKPEALEAAILSLMRRTPEEREQIGQSGARFYEERMSLAVGTSAFVDQFRRLCGRA